MFVRVVLTVVVACAWSITLLAQVVPGEGPGMRRFDLVYQAEVRNIPSGAERIAIWIPLPSDDGHQDIQDLQVDTPYPWTVATDPEYSNRMVHLALVGPQAPSVPVTLRARVTRREHRKSLAPVSDPEPFDGRWLMPDRLVPLDDFVTQLAAQVTAGATTPRDKARAVYDYVVDTMTYDKSGTGWGRGDIYWACDAKTGNCTDFHALFIGLNRAVGIPASFEIGFPLPPDRSEGTIAGYHCWAQFYLDGVGWVPVDTSEANRNPEQREYFFGAHDAHRVLFSKGRDIILEPPQQGPPLNYFIYPYVEVDGEPFDDIALDFRFRDVLPVTDGG